MATLRVRFRDGDTDEWTMHERMDLGDLAKFLTESLGRPSIVSFGIASRSGDTPADYGFLGLRMAEVIWWDLDGMVDEEALLGPWSEADAMNRQREDE